MQKHEMMDKIIQYQMRKISTSQVAKYLDEYTEALSQHDVIKKEVAVCVGCGNKMPEEPRTSNCCDECWLTN